LRPYLRVVSTFDLPPLQGASLWWRPQGWKPWAKSSSPFGAEIPDAGVVGSSGGGGISGRGWVGGVAGGDGVPGSGVALVFISASALLSVASYSAFEEAISMENVSKQILFGSNSQQCSRKD
jgi:hypothetical protein